MERKGKVRMPNRAAWAEVDLAAYAQNIEVIKKCVQPGAQLCMVVKADAYGHGAVPCARIAVAHGASYLAVATISEGIELREAGFTQPILMLGLILPEEAASVVSYGITQTVCTRELAEALSAAAVAQGRTAKVHLKVETGMGRIGVRPEEAADLAAAIAALPGLVLEGVFSHFATADDRDKTYAHAQLASFRQALAAIEARGIHVELRHIAESAAILEMPEAHFDMVRVGIIQHGLWPSAEVSHPIPLRETMQLKARVVFLKHVHPGESIGYGRAFVAERESLIATLPIGYADGYIRAYGAEGYVLIRGRRARICGRVCMDQVMVDVTDIPGVAIGDTALLFGGEALPTDTAARWLDTINYEVTCLVAPRVPRVYAG